MSTDPTIEKVTTDRLRPGDVVVQDGMRLVIDRPIDTTATTTATVFSTPARIDNWNELVAEAADKAAAGIANSAAQFITRHADHDDGEHRWTIQGNALAPWWRETTSRSLALVVCLAPGQTGRGTDH